MRKMRRGQIMMEYVVLATLIFAVLCGTVTGIVVAHRAGSSMWRGLGWGIAVGVVSPLALGAFALLLPAGLKCIIWVCAGGVLISRVVLGILQAVVIGMIKLGVVFARTLLFGGLLRPFSTNGTDAVYHRIGKDAFFRLSKRDTDESHNDSSAKCRVSTSVTEVYFVTNWRLRNHWTMQPNIPQKILKRFIKIFDAVVPEMQALAREKYGFAQEQWSDWSIVFVNSTLAEEPSIARKLKGVPIELVYKVAAAFCKESGK